MLLCNTKILILKSMKTSNKLEAYLKDPGAPFFHFYLYLSTSYTYRSTLYNSLTDGHSKEMGIPIFQGL